MTLQGSVADSGVRVKVNLELSSVKEHSVPLPDIVMPERVMALLKTWHVVIGAGGFCFVCTAE